MVAASAILASCAKSEQVVPAEDLAMAEESVDPTLIPGEMIVEFSEEMTAQIEKALESEGVPQTKSAGLNEAFKAMGVVSMERIYPDAGKWEPRHREAGLHRWYKLKFDPAFPQTKASQGLEGIDGVVYVEPERRIHATALDIFNDPKLNRQWHYYNDGTAGSAYKAGSDINVLQVWQNYTCGSKDVIVAVEDVGVDLEHEDLAAACIPGGKDGSRCFVEGYTGFTIYPGDHGTHVAGTIAAINNNGIGVCGIAGGSNGTGGVRIMSVQIMHKDPKDPSKTLQGDSRNAMIWAADHGAVISQNSWGYDYKNATDAANGSVGSIKPAIDYFIQYAGIDENGKQTGPMKGGVVIFAAGNDGWPHGWPAEYEPVIAVGAMSSALTKSYYSNYGPWVDIAAPGGDANLGPQVYSTISNNGYGSMQGTSMACPHVSGVAALIVSYFGGEGFTNKMLIEKLIGGASSKLSSAYQIGPAVDALGSFTFGGTLPPEAVTSYTAEPSSNNIICTWNVTADPDDKVAHHYVIAYSKDMSALEQYNPKTSNQSVKAVSVEVGAKSVGEAITGTVSGLDFDTQYYVGIIAVDYSNNYSAMSSIKAVKTGKNNPPVITSDYTTKLEVKAHETTSVAVNFSDPDGHAVTHEFTSGSDAATLGQAIGGSGFVVTIVGNKAAPGTYTATLKVTDSFGASSSLDIVYNLHPNHAPTVVSATDDVVLVSDSDTKTIDLAGCFADEDGETLKYEATTSTAGVVHAYAYEGKLTLTALGYGMTEVKVKASDTSDASCEMSFKVIVHDPKAGPEFAMKSGVLSINTYYSGDVNVLVTNAAGAKVIDQKFSSDPFTPIEINMSSCAPGRYGVRVEYGGMSFEDIVIKK